MRGAGSRSCAAAIGSVVLVGLLFVFVYPTRTFLDQRDATNRARAQLELLKSENAKLAHEAKRLKSDAEIERLARAVRTGQTGRAAVRDHPARPPPVPPPEATNPAP